MKTKLQTLVEAFDAGDLRRAVAIAARFPQLGAHRSAVLDAHMAFTNERFCRALKKDPEALKAAGRQALLDGWITPRRSKTAPQATPAA